MATDQYGLLAPSSFYSWAEYADYLWKHIERGQAAIALWREHEWAGRKRNLSTGVMNVKCCIVCGNTKEQGHTAGCELDEVINAEPRTDST